VGNALCQRVGRVELLDGGYESGQRAVPGRGESEVGGRGFIIVEATEVC